MPPVDPNANPDVAASEAAAAAADAVESLSVAERILAAHERFDRAVGNVRNAVALPDDDPRGREQMLDRAVTNYTSALLFLDDVQAEQRKNSPVGDVPPEGELIAPADSDPAGQARAAADATSSPAEPVGDTAA